MSENRCVSCGEIIPEGRQICPHCWFEEGRKQHNLSKYSVVLLQGRKEIVLNCETRKMVRQLVRWHKHGADAVTVISRRFVKRPR